MLVTSFVWPTKRRKSSLTCLQHLLELPIRKKSSPITYYNFNLNLETNEHKRETYGLNEKEVNMDKMEQSSISNQNSSLLVFSFHFTCNIKMQFFNSSNMCNHFFLSIYYNKNKKVDEKSKKQTLVWKEIQILLFLYSAGAQSARDE